MSENLSFPRSDLLLYVSGEMPAHEASLLEQRMLEDGAFSEAVAAVEFSLMEDFAADMLSARERQQATDWIARSPRRRLEVRIAKQLHRTKTRRGRTFFPVPLRAPAWGALLGLLLLCLLLPLGWKRLHPTQVTPPGRTQSAPASASATPAPLDTILLAAERLRGADTPRQPPVFEIHAGDAIRLQVLLPASSAGEAYAVTVRSREAAAMQPLQFANIAPSGTSGSGFLQVVLPPHSLRAGSQEVEIDSPRSKYKVRFDLRIVPAPDR